MPKLALDGKKTKVTAILEGDARQQFDAVWHFIQQAESLFGRRMLRDEN